MSDTDGSAAVDGQDRASEPEQDPVRSTRPGEVDGAEVEAKSYGSLSEADARTTENDGRRTASEDGNGLPPSQRAPDDAPAISVEASTNTDDKKLPPVPAETLRDGALHVDPRSLQPGSPGQPSGAESDAVPDLSRPRTQSLASSNGAARPPLPSSMIFVVSALESIASSKDARRRRQLGDATQKALNAIKESDPQLPDPEIVFQPLQLATMTGNVTLTTVALDCIGKLISYSYFAAPYGVKRTQEDGSEGPLPLIERAIDTIIECFQGEATPHETQLQIVKSLLAAVLNDKIVVHGAGLLKAVRQTYNIFLLSKSSSNQQIAQGTLTQMIGTIFERLKIRLALKEARLKTSKHPEAVESTDSSPLAVDAQDPTAADDEPNGTHDGSPAYPLADSSGRERKREERITLQSFENRKSFDDDRINDDAPTTVTRAPIGLQGSRTPSGLATRRQSHRDSRRSDDTTDDDEEDEIYIKDAFLVFRAMCKLSIKTLPAEQLLDLKSQGMRQKLLSLHLVHTILNSHMLVFTSPLATIRSSSSDEPSTFLQATKQYLCLSLSRNGASSVNRVFEVSCEIFWLMLKSLRVMLKKEIEVFLKEIYLAILERRNAPMIQRQCLLNVLERLAADPRALVEIYLNYDCDRAALDNMFQRIIEHLSRISSTTVTVSPAQQQQYREQLQRASHPTTEWQEPGTLPPSLSTANITDMPEPESTVPVEYALRQKSLNCLVTTLRSLVNWSQQDIAETSARLQDPGSLAARINSRESLDALGQGTGASTPKVPQSDIPTEVTASMGPLEDDPGEFGVAKQQKTALLNGIKQFNFKPKRGIKYLIKEGFVPSDAPQDVAAFLLHTQELDKAMIGEYLGEGEQENVATMHAFVDLMDFRRTRFVDALRRFLQSFRLPGEAQKIDRFMLKFAERYISGNPKAFANADTAYVLAYSAIMLNTDLHSAKIKGRRMTKEEFIKNNRGINDDADLPDEYLEGIYDEIAHNEIVLYTERESAGPVGPTLQPNAGLAANIGQALATVGRDLQREAYVQASEEMANKTEQLFRNLLRAQRKSALKPELSRFIPATSFKHVGPMFDVTWMSLLMGLAGQVQDTHNQETTRLCMEGFRYAIRICCLFELDTPRVAFVSALAKFTHLNNLNEMTAKNFEALKSLLEVAQAEGNLLKDSWKDILACISQLDRFQLISAGVDEGAVPDMFKAGIVPPARADSGGPRKSAPGSRKPRSRAPNSTTNFPPAIALESRSTDIIKTVDRIFTTTANLSGEAIVHFVRALSEVSWQEIQSSGQSESPRTFSLQKLVEISYYNMTRVRFEWSAVWQVLGEHFNHVGCHINTNVVFMALDSLRQLSMRFMELEELPGFKFQKDFLKPFEHVMANSGTVMVKDMVLRCLIQMIQARGNNIRSGWKTMFGVFTVAAREPYESIVNLASDNVTQIYNTRFGLVISQGAFADLVVCLTEFSKNMKFQKKSLQAIELIKSTVPKMLKTAECPLSSASRSKKGQPRSESERSPTRIMQEEQFWFPVLFAFHNVLMTGDDLEVRSRALSYLFEGLIRYGGDFSPEFWDILWRQLLYPIFMVLKSKSELTKVMNHEELSVWLSTTMIQALRNMIALFTHYFQSLEYMLDRFLDLLTLCICQENDTIARIGSNCLQQLILQNVDKFNAKHWMKIVGAFVELFERTTADQLFTAAGSSVPATPITNGERTPKPESQPSPANAQSGTALDETAADPDDPNTLTINGLPLTGPLSIRTDVSQAATSGPGDDAAQSAQSATGATELEDYRPASELQQQPVVVTTARRRIFNKIIMKCVLQLLMIETVNELFSNDTVYTQIPSGELLRLMTVLRKSFLFARKFNGDKDLRMRLWRDGFMKQPPNLLKQESGSAATYVSILLRMYHDEGEERKKSQAEIEAALIPLCVDIIQGYVLLDEDTQQRNILAWRPVVVEVLEGYTHFPLADFDKYVETFYPLAVELLDRDLGHELRLALQALYRRIGECRMGMSPVSNDHHHHHHHRGGDAGGAGGAGHDGQRRPRESSQTQPPGRQRHNRNGSSLNAKNTSGISPTTTTTTAASASGSAPTSPTMTSGASHSSVHHPPESPSTGARAGARAREGAGAVGAAAESTSPTKEHKHHYTPTGHSSSGSASVSASASRSSSTTTVPFPTFR